MQDHKQAVDRIFLPFLGFSFCCMTVNFTPLFLAFLVRIIHGFCLYFSRVLLPPAKLAVIPLGVVPCNSDQQGSEWTWLEHLPHAIKRDNVRWSHAGFVRQETNGTSYVTSLSVDVIKVSPNVTHHVREIMWKSMVYVGVDSTRRLVWCIPSATMTALFLSVLRSIQPSTPYERTLFILQPHLLDDLFAAVSYEIEAAGYKGAVFGYAEVCRRPEGELDPRGPRVSRKLSDHKAVDKLVSEHAPHAVIDAVNVTMAWLPPADIETANSEHVQPVSQPATALVSTWVSYTGVSWVDVEAGPFSWGSGTPGQSFHRKTQYLLDSGNHSTKCLDSVAVGRALNEFVSQIALPANGLYFPMLNDLVSDSGLARIQDTFPDRLHYHLFIVKSHSNVDEQYHAKASSHEYTTHSPYDPFSGLNLTAIKSALQTVVMTGQDVFVSVQSLCPEDDVVVGTSLAASMRHAKVARLTSDGNIVSQYQPYLDTAALGRLLEKHSHDIGDGLMGTMKTSTHVPILLFSLDADPPLLLDRDYIARPAAGMTIGVQSPKKQYTIPITVNEEALSWNLLDPSAALVQSTLELLFGLLPSTVAVASHGRISESWLWAVGDDVTSVINSGSVHVSQAAIATMLRNKGEVVRSVVDVAYDECLSVLAEHPQQASNSTLRALVTDLFDMAVQTDVTAATPRELRQIIAASSSILKRCLEWAKMAQREKCATKHGSPTRGHTLPSPTLQMVLISCSVLLSVGLGVRWWRGYRHIEPFKTKIN